MPRWSPRQHPNRNQLPLSNKKHFFSTLYFLWNIHLWFAWRMKKECRSVALFKVVLSQPSNQNRGRVWVSVKRVWTNATAPISGISQIGAVALLVSALQPLYKRRSGVVSVPYCSDSVTT
jgi:hypothetical protein